MKLIDRFGTEREVPRAPEELEDIVADAMHRYGPDRHTDGHQEIAALVHAWLEDGWESIKQTAIEAIPPDDTPTLRTNDYQPSPYAKLVKHILGKP